MITRRVRTANVPGRDFNVTAVVHKHYSQGTSCSDAGAPPGLDYRYQTNLLSFRACTVASCWYPDCASNCTTVMSFPDEILISFTVGKPQNQTTLSSASPQRKFRPRLRWETVTMSESDVHVTVSASLGLIITVNINAVSRPARRGVWTARRKRRVNRCSSVPREPPRTDCRFDRLDLDLDLVTTFIIIIIIFLVISTALSLFRLRS